MNKCPPGKIKNPATGRCVSKTGKLGKELLGKSSSPRRKSTTRKNSIKRKSTTRKSSSKRKSTTRKSSSKRQTSCPTGKIINPVTGRCVSKTGKLGREILGKSRSPKRRSMKSTSHRSTKKSLPCPSGKIINPTTGRCVSKTGKLGREILGKSRSPIRKHRSMFKSASPRNFKKKTSKSTVQSSRRTTSKTISQHSSDKNSQINYIESILYIPDAFENIIESMSLKDIYNLCSSSKEIAKRCETASIKKIISEKKLKARKYATIHLVDMYGGFLDVKGKGYNTKVSDIEKVHPGISKMFKRGDIIEFTKTSGYRSNGRMMVDVQDGIPTLIPMNHEYDEYGSPSKIFWGIVEFPLDYWYDDKIYINNKYTKTGPKSYWNNHTPPVFVPNIFWEKAKRIDPPEDLPSRIDLDISPDPFVAGELGEVEYEFYKYGNKIYAISEYTAWDRLNYMVRDEIVNEPEFENIIVIG